MGLIVFVGNALIAFGPLLSIFFLYVHRIPQLVLIGVVASFFYLLSILLVSIVYTILPHSLMIYHKIIVTLTSVLCFELLRFVFYFLYKRSEKGFRYRIIESKFGSIPIAIAAGIGYAASQILITFGTFLMQTLGPATLYKGCGILPLVTVNALMNCAMTFVNIYWMIIAFQAYGNGSWWRFVILIMTHFILKGFSLLNPLMSDHLQMDNVCYLNIPFMFMFLLFSSAGICFELFTEYGKWKEQQGVTVKKGSTIVMTPDVTKEDSEPKFHLDDPSDEEEEETLQFAKEMEVAHRDIDNEDA